MLRTALLLSVSILAVLANSVPAAAQWIESVKLTAAGAARWDNFGWAVAVSGKTAIVGEASDDHAGAEDSGSAHFFATTTGDRLFKLTPIDRAKEDWFGWSVGIDGNTAIVGAPGHGESGAAYLFDVAAEQQLFKLIPDDAAGNDTVRFFGDSVAINGNTAIVGDSWTDHAGEQTGSAYLFDATTGRQLFTLTASDPAAGDFFGCSVAISGNTAIVGAWGNNDEDAGFDSGSAYLFDAATGSQLRKLVASGAAENDRFGLSVAISGNTAIIGAWGDDDSGSAYVFDVATGDQLFKLTACDPAAGDYFGYSVAISGDTAIIGAWGDDDVAVFSGSAYLFDVATGRQIQKLTASDAAWSDQFGYSVAIDGNTAVVGTKWRNGPLLGLPGSAYVFVPEPSSVWLSAMAALALLSYAWRRRRM